MRLENILRSSGTKPIPERATSYGFHPTISFPLNDLTAFVIPASIARVFVIIAIDPLTTNKKAIISAAPTIP